VVRVDSSTGIVDVVPGYSGSEALPEAVTRFLVTQYVTERERYVPALAEADYEQVGAFHSAAMNQRWAGAWAKTNPESPLNRYADGTSVRAQVQSVAFLKQGHGSLELIQVRFLSAAQHGAGGEEERAHYVATLQVAFGKPSTDVHLRTLNPLGFKVLEYRREPEAVEAAVVAPATAPPAAPAATGGAP
jgi:type IV secretion system protein VirB8